MCKYVFNSVWCVRLVYMCRYVMYFPKFNESKCVKKFPCFYQSFVNFWKINKELHHCHIEGVNNLNLRQGVFRDSIKCLSLLQGATI